MGHSSEVFFIFLIGFTLNNHVACQDPCVKPCYCPNYYDPVCASDGKTYYNPCYAGCENDKLQCQGKPQITLLYKGPCTCSQPCYCPYILQPVCGSDGRTYRNECFLNCQNKIQVCNGQPGVTLACDGYCPNPYCSYYCPTTYNPVCGSDGKTYQNQCFFNCANKVLACSGKKPVTITCYAECPEPCPCPYIIDPVCASDGKTYANTCLVVCENKKRKCQGKKPLYLLYKGKCDCSGSCNCPQVIQPVCSTDGTTYNNECLLICQSIKQVCAGKNSVEKGCDGPCPGPCICPTIFDPVCGSDGITYSNDCLLQCESKKRVCGGKTAITIVKKGQC